MFSIPEKANINGFKRVHIARGSDLFARFGKMSSNVGTSDGHVIPMNQNKLDYMDYVDEYDRMMSERENVSEVQKEISPENDPSADET